MTNGVFYFIFSERDEDESASLNKSEMNSNRNESFINTASKLLERVKQQQQHSISFEESSSTPKVPTKTTVPVQLKQNPINGQTTQTQSATTNIKC